MLGFPIRTPWDHSLVDSSPRPIAASHVLHRLLVPRHPPFALDNLTTENKMLASTVQFSTNDQPTTPRPATEPKPSNHQEFDGIAGQAVPGIEDQPPPTGRSLTPTSLKGQHGCSFRYPTGCKFCAPSPAAPDTTFHHPPKGVRTRRPGRCRFRLASVSAFEHPTTTLEWRGLLDQFPGLVAP